MFASVLTIACTGTVARLGASVREEQVRFHNGDVTLAGTLFLPSNPGKHPAIVLYHGSGPQPRYPGLARWFAGLGIAALTYDKRGVGESTGDFKKVSFLDLSSDGLAAVDLLKARRDVDPRKIGVWGLSQGGWLGPLAASRSSDIAFVIAVSGPGVSPGEQMVFFYASELRAQGLPDEQVQEASKLRQQPWTYVSTGTGYAATKSAIDQAKSRPWYAQVKAQRDDPFETFQNAAVDRNRLWFRVEMNYDPVATLRKLTVPALFLFGDADQLVPVPKSVEIINQTLTAIHHPDFTIRVFPGVDHGMYLASDNRQEVPAYRQTMKNWLIAHHFASENGAP
ncbi:MAG TPA: alpha/beta fold hydrolase [Bryobacteraceae bacterium]|nr:alpha/beta fold hydrolase [Bryobacteraceae bacterium]